VGMSARLQSRTDGVLWFAVYIAAYFLAFRYGTFFGHSNPSPFWFPDSILLCALLRTRPRDWWLFIAVALPIRMLFTVPLHLPGWYILASFALDAVKAVVGAVILRRLLVDPLRLDTVREFLLFILVAVLAVSAVSAFAGAAIRATLGYPYWPSWERWFSGNALAQLIITPTILCWVFGTPWRYWKLDFHKALEAIGLTLGLFLACYLAASTSGYGTFNSETRFYSPVVFLIWAAIRFGMPGATAANALVAIVAVGLAMSGVGPFAHHTTGEAAIGLQSFLLLRSAPSFFIAIAVEQRRRAEEDLRESEERFRRMAHSAPVLLWMSGKDKGGNFFNRGWLEFTGRTLEQELGGGWAEGVHPDDLHKCLARYHAAFDARQPFEIEYRLRRYDGEYRWVLDIGAPRYESDGAFAGYIGSAIDITDRKRSEEIQRALAHTQRLAVMGELTAALAHEVRQPMSAILLDAKMAEKLALERSLTSDDMRVIAGGIREHATRADQVINRILGYLRKQDSQIRPIDINAVVQDVLNLLDGDAARRNVQVRPVLSRNLPPVYADRTQLEQVLLNLVVNGMDAMEEVPETARHLTVRTALTPNGSVEVTVSDCGRGIDSDKLPLLFESFFSTRKEGMGLGLSIAKSIVDAHHGRIWAENNRGSGASFHFTVPTVSEEMRARAS
jgi:two-component system, LuxR family, sensor kinase FixL